MIRKFGNKRIIEFIAFILWLPYVSEKAKLQFDPADCCGNRE